MQAVVITAYKDAKQLDELLKTLYGKFKVYLHIDAKSEELEELKIKNRYPLVKVVKKFQINWGGKSSKSNIRASCNGCGE